MATAPSDAPSTETQEELAAALHQVIAQLGSGEMDFPTRLIDASLARDGEVSVIAHLADLAALAAHEEAAASGHDPQEVVQRFAEAIDPREPPSIVLAWKRAADAVLHLLGAPFPEMGDGSVEPEALATALLSLQLLSCIDLAVWKQDPGLMRKNLAARWAAGNP